MQIKLTNVRLSFAQIWKATAFNEGQTPKFSANFLLDKNVHKKQIDSIKKTIKQMQTAAFGGTTPARMEYCFNDGESKAYDGYDNCYYIAAGSTNRPKIIDRDRGVLVQQDDRPYSGCYVNAALSLWVQNNQWGKAIRCELKAIQFVKDGDRFGAKPVNTDEVFDDISEESAVDAAEDDFLS